MASIASRDFYDPELKRANLDALAEPTRASSFVEGDMNEIDARELLQGVDVVYHLAGQPGVGRSWGDEFEAYVDDNVISTQRLLEAARRHRT